MSAEQEAMRILRQKQRRRPEPRAVGDIVGRLVNHEGAPEPGATERLYGGAEHQPEHGGYRRNPMRSEAGDEARRLACDTVAALVAELHVEREKDADPYDGWDKYKQRLAKEKALDSDEAWDVIEDRALAEEESA